MSSVWNRIGIVLLLLLAGIVGGVFIGHHDREPEVQNLNRQLTELRLTCNNQEMMEVIEQALSPLAMDELRLAAEQLKQQRLRLIKKRREKSSNEN